MLIIGSVNITVKPNDSYSGQVYDKYNKFDSIIEPIPAHNLIDQETKNDLVCCFYSRFGLVISIIMLV